MTFALTTQCLFCDELREVNGKEKWATLLSVFVPTRHDGSKRIRLGAGQVATVCRKCRKEHTIEEFIEKARGIY
jgi:hypothetical protein